MDAMTELNTYSNAKNKTDAMTELNTYSNAKNKTDAMNELNTYSNAKNKTEVMRIKTMVRINTPGWLAIIIRPSQ